MKKFINILKNLKNDIINHYKNSYSNSGKGVRIFCTILFSLLFGISFMGSGLPIFIDWILFSLIGFLIFWLARIALMVAFYPVKKIGINNASCIILASYSLYILIEDGIGNTIESKYILIIVTIIIILEILFASSLWSIFINKKRNKTLIFSVVITTTVNICIIQFMDIDGFENKMFKKYLDVSINHKKNDNDLYSLSLESGSFNVKTFQYGMDNNSKIKSKTISLTKFMTKMKGYKAYLRKLYLRYDEDTVPLKAKVWYPEVEKNNTEKFPLLVIAHGNHSITTDSYLGYTYLAKHLVSKGYIVVSIDANVCNGYVTTGYSNENDARAVLMLEHIKFLEELNTNKDNPLYNLINFDNIVLAGHSRGGEAAAVAAMFNQIGHYPENVNIKFDYNYNIKGVIAIAPTNNQYMPAGKDAAFEDISYFLIHGMNDQDVTNVKGINQYNNVVFTGTKDCFKSYLYIAGANHGQFNSRWGLYDLSFPTSWFLNVEPFIQDKLQKQILKAYVTAFMENITKQKTEYRDLFKNYERYNETMPETLYINGYKDSTFKSICDYEEDTDVYTATLKNTKIYASGFTRWSETLQKYSLSSNDSMNNNGVMLKWGDSLNANYTIYFQNYLRIKKNECLEFDIMNTDNSLAKDKNYYLTDFDIILTDKNENTVVLSLIDYYNVYEPIPTTKNKVQSILKHMDYKILYQTVRISAQDILQKNQKFDLNSIDSIQFKFNKYKNGKIMLDNIGISKN